MIDADRVIFAWGQNAKVPKPLRNQWRRVWAMTKLQPYCLGVGKDGHPYHPLMLAYDTPLIEWSPPQ